MMTKVANLYHTKSLGQSEIAQRLGISQARVSRLLSNAREQGIVISIVKSPTGLFSELEQVVEAKFGISQVHIVDAMAESEVELTGSLGAALASFFEVLPLDGKSVGFTSWSRSLRSFVKVLPASQRVRIKKIVELLGDVGEPTIQHVATTATENLARLTNAEPIFLRVPAILGSKDLQKAWLENQPHSLKALSEYKDLDVALVGIGAVANSGGVDSPQHEPTESNFFTEKQLEVARAAGAVAEINLRFIDINGQPVKTELDDLVVGLSLTELKRIPFKIGVSGGIGKHLATLAVVRGKWIDVLVTDNETANYLLQS
jgi:DNA-binding transcriptional regulator LsrR (DeoR family)